MATAAIEDIIKVNFVLVGYRLLSTQEEVDAFTEGVGSDVQISGAGFTANVQSGLTEPLYSLVLNKDRITLELSSLRSTISRDYPEKEDLQRLSDVVTAAIVNTPSPEQPPRAFGYNIELVFDPRAGTPAFQFLGHKLFRAELGNQGWTLSGGSAKLIFRDDSDAGSSTMSWTATIEPRFNDVRSSRVFLSLNLHRAEQRIPTAENIESDLSNLWNQASEFIQQLQGNQ